MPPAASALESAWLSQRAYTDLPPEAERAIRRAGVCWHDEPAALRHLEEARALAPDHLAVWIAQYRFHFYKHRYADAERCARVCLEQVALQLGVPPEITEVQPTHANFSADDALLRFWLFGVQAYGYVLIRLGQTARGYEVLRKLTQLDTSDCTKTRVLLDVMQRPVEDEEGG
ncbi:MAG TPA: hypothetical protein VFQ61_27690 [Polyangiaceae bacterium]|nr:hypothetical protein [Polyangiaceae bacterium]